MADEYFIPIYCILPKKCVVKEIFISEWRIGDVHGLTNNRRKHNIKSPNGCMTGYEDIIHLAHHVSVRHPQMSREDRAAQFAPFAALTGHKDAIRETERLTERKRRLSEDCRQILDLYLREVCQSQEPREVDFEYFVPDQKKEGGSYQKKSGCIRRIDTYLNEIVLQSGDRIPLDEIVDIDGVIAAADEV